ncbi:hypothetical protein HMPREF0201_04445 [Cedecea davisae DSM 4568]|uniref:Uncharacterized protein n=1 Tax=Cedecea davisae DSM 4568 TaxID=566551 RepID=S3IYV4_9ENTR|nr:hypothetical protein HMPREF0201_04445 [Cedecea davisae DSM 4568]
MQYGITYHNPALRLRAQPRRKWAGDLPGKLWSLFLIAFVTQITNNNFRYC